VSSLEERSVCALIQVTESKKGSLQIRRAVERSTCLHCLACRCADYGTFSEAAKDGRLIAARGFGASPIRTLLPRRVLCGCAVASR
jgi:hypothetical protein